MHTGDTAQRSLQHWSDQGIAEMEAFYVLAAEDYRQLALAVDWATLLGEHAHERWTLLDVACGSGKFPTALLEIPSVAALPAIAYDLLDPSAFSVATARASLAPPFIPRNDLVMPLQELALDGSSYDIVWATHALYAIPPGELDLAMACFASALAPEGLGVIAQATARSHYLAFYDAFRAGVREATPYISAEMVATSLRTAGVEVREQMITYETGTSDRGVAEGFLQRCAFDDSVSLEEMEAAPVLGDYLASCRRPDGSYVFGHEVAMLWM